MTCSFNKEYIIWGIGVQTSKSWIQTLYPIKCVCMLNIEHNIEIAEIRLVGWVVFASICVYVWICRKLYKWNFISQGIKTVWHTIWGKKSNNNVKLLPWQRTCFCCCWSRWIENRRITATKAIKSTHSHITLFSVYIAFSSSFVRFHPIITINGRLFYFVLEKNGSLHIQFIRFISIIPVHWIQYNVLVSV